jgi:hypothetical protein
MSSGSGGRGNSTTTPERDRGARRGLIGKAVGITVVTFVAIGILVPYSLAIRHQIGRYRLDHHGVLSSVKVIRAQTVEQSDENGTSYEYWVFVRIPRSSVVDRLPIAGPTFPVGSTIQIRYDPKNPTNAIAVQNAPFPASIVFGTIFVMAILFAVGAGMAWERRTAKRWQRATSALGWTYEATSGPLDIPLASLGTARPNRRNLVTGTRSGVRFAAFTCDVGGGDSSVTYRVAAIEGPTTYPHLWIHKRGHRAPSKKRREQVRPEVPIGSPQFADAFVVVCADAPFAEALLDGPVQAWLVGQGGFTRYELIDSRVFVVDRTKPKRPESLEQAVDRAVAFFLRLPAVSRGGEAWATAAPWEAGDAWNRLGRVMWSGGTVKGSVLEAHSTGLLIDLGELRGFLPKKHLENGRAQKLQSYVGRVLECRVVKVDRRRNNVVLSRRELLP